MKLSNNTETRKLKFGAPEEVAIGTWLCISDCECYQLVWLQPVLVLDLWEVHTGNGEADFTGSLVACKAYCQGMEDGLAMVAFARHVEERLDALK